MSISTTAPRIVGCDVGKARIEIFDSHDQSRKSIANDPAALAEWTATLDPDCLVVCEATGGYEAALLAALLAAGVPAHRADARKVKAFIRSLGVHGKTDALDARALARYGQERHLQLARWQAPDKARGKLQALALTRRDLVVQRTAFSNRAQAPGAEPVQSYLKALLDCLDAQIAAIDADIAALIEAHDELRRSEKALRSIAGLGAKTAAALLALMPELGSCDRRRAASLAGLAPHPRQSGEKDAYRRMIGGRPEVKRVLFMAAMSAARHNPVLRDVYKRLLANGKKPIVALSAIMRKIIVIANARLRDLKMAPQLS
jgi:transposase